MTDAHPKEWMTAAEIAALKLSALPATERNVNALAQRDGWRDSTLARQRSGRGGGWEYHWKLITGPAAADLETRIKREADEGRGAALAKARGTELEAQRPAAVSLTAGQRAVMEARAAVLTEVDRILVSEPRARTQSLAIAMLLDRVALGVADDPVAIAARVASERETLSRSAIFGWMRARAQLGLIGLAPKLKRRKADLPPWFEAWLPHYAKPAKPCISEALDEYRRSLSDPAAAPTYDQVRRAIAKLGPLERVQGREGKLAMRKRLAYVSRDTSNLLPSSIYVADGKTFDAEITHPTHGRPFRPEITTMVDAATRLCVGWSVDVAERAFAVVEALRRACVECGIPAIFYTDRGPGYIASAVTDTVLGFLARLSITPMKALPYNSQAKGVVERLNQLYTPLAKSFPTYIGKDMDPEAKKLAFKVTRGEMKAFGTSRTLPTWQKFVDDLADTIERYNNRPHSELPKIMIGGRRRHMSPREAWDAKCAEGFEPIVPLAAELDDLFRPYVVRIAKRGLIEHNTNRYFLQALEAFDGMKVVVGYENFDASKVWVRRLDKTADGERPGAAIGIAIFEGNKRHYVPVSAHNKALETRARGQKKRLAAHEDTIDAQFRADLLIEHAPGTPVPFMSLDVPASVPVAANDSPPLRLRPDGIPIFSDDVAQARWFLANPDRLGTEDAAYLRERLSTPSTRDLFASCGLDLDALKGLVRSAAGDISRKSLA